MSEKKKQNKPPKDLNIKESRREWVAPTLLDYTAPTSGHLPPLGSWCSDGAGEP